MIFIGLSQKDDLTDHEMSKVWSKEIKIELEEDGSTVGRGCL